MIPLELGVAKVDITPKMPIPLAGFAHRLGSYEAITRPIYARIFVFRQHADYAVIISADLIWWGSDRVPTLKKQIHEQWGISESSILLHGTHNHSGPQPSCSFTASLGEPSLPYIEWLEETVLEGIKLAFQTIESVVVESQRGICEIGVNRRKWIDGTMQMAPNPDGPVDPDLVVIRYRTEKQESKAMMIHYACHPTTTGDPYLSSDYSGFAMEQLESRLGEGAVSAFFQGCCGDIRPALVQEGRFYRGSDDEVRKLGGILVDEVMELLKKPMVVHDPQLKPGKKLLLPLSFQHVPTTEELDQSSREHGIVGEWAQGLLVRHPKPTIDLEMTYLSLADQLSFLSFNSELVVEYGLFIKRHFPGVLPIPYTNGMIGYIPTKQQLEDGGYEASESTSYFGLPSRFSPAIEQDIKNYIRLWIRKEHIND